MKKLRNSNKKRMKRKLKRYWHAYRKGIMTEEDIRRSLVSYVGHLSHGDTWHLRENILRHLVMSVDTEERRREHEQKIKDYIDQFDKSWISGKEVPVSTAGPDAPDNVLAGGSW